MTAICNSSCRGFQKQSLASAAALGASRRIERKRVEGFLGHVFEPPFDKYPWMGLSLAMLSCCCRRSSSQVAGNFKCRPRRDGLERHMS
jgi:hypothetical protein